MATKPTAKTGGLFLLMGSDVGERTAIRIGLLFSTTGPYATIGRAMRNGSMLAIGEVNADASFPFTLDPLEADPDGRNAVYAELACRMLTAERLVHVVGCYTSSSRKEVLPYFEKYDGLLWYPSHYEGFESSEHVISRGLRQISTLSPLPTICCRHCGSGA